ncbi:MAG: cupin domain-containing protein, partial [Chloroflexi bacterium]|nr:cupin domain-containing protein [Chloroflexota bacterium]
LDQASSDEFDGTTVEYRDPASGKHADPRIGAWLTRLPAAFAGKPHRHTYSHLYYVHDGEGHTIVNGKRLDWAEGDVFTVPAWSLHEHHAGSSAAHLFSVNEIPTLAALNLLRSES